MSVKIILILASIAAAHNCKLLTVAPDYSGVEMTCGDWAGGSQTYWRPSKADWSKATNLDTTVIATTDTTKR